MSSTRKSKGGYAKKVWEPSEDAILRNTILSNGPLNWNVVASYLSDRTGKQCRERWHNHLADGIKKGDWSKEEDSIILSAHRQFGNQWARISKMLPSRTENDIKNRYYMLERNQKRADDESDASSKHSLSPSVESNTSKKEYRFEQYRCHDEHETHWCPNKKSRTESIEIHSGFWNDFGKDFNSASDCFDSFWMDDFISTVLDQE